MAAVSEQYHRRIKHDLTELYGDPVEGIYVAQDENQNNRVHALIVGPPDTPYDGGFFYFLFTYPTKYPLVPPSVQFMTTGDGRIRFNPNLYACGKVCLSILGTWSGPAWASVMTTKSVLISIQSLIMNDQPYFNEPGFENLKDKSESKAISDKYNAKIRYFTMKVAVNDMVGLCKTERFAMPQVLKEIVKFKFCENIERYKTLLDELDKVAGLLKAPKTDRSQMLMGPISPAAEEEWQDLRKRTLTLFEGLNFKSEENMAMQLYNSLGEAYCSGQRQQAPELQVEQIIEELFSPSDDDDCVEVEPYSEDDDGDEVQVIKVVSSSSK